MKRILQMMSLGLIYPSISILATAKPETAETEKQPNILLIITDDQGLSDLAFYGNPSLETPHLDKLASQSIRLEDFMASPTCSPTRAALMTGQHEFKVGITHTISGRSVLKPGILTLPEYLKKAGYRTGIFGKWHLGETYPSRPEDRGFDEVFIHLGGGIGQTPDYWGNQYFDPHILHNGEWVKTEGYCTKVFKETALQWIEDGGPEPWFAYLSYNAPHTPLQIHESLAEKYLKKGLPESQARFYAMIEDLDREVGELLAELKTNGTAENTIIIFMGDNGSAKGGRPDEMEFNAGLRATKASPYQGGVRVPGFIHWPAGGFDSGRSVNEMTSVIDLFPTLADLIGLPLDENTPTDGKSIVPLLRGKHDSWEDRTLVTHVGRWANRKAAEHKHIGSAIRNERYTLVNGTELYDLLHDRGEERDISGDMPEVVDSLSKAYEKWWQQVKPMAEDVLPMTVGAPEAPISHLTCMDWGASNIGEDEGRYPPWNQAYIRTLGEGKPLDHISPVGAWNLNFTQTGTYKITIRRYPAEAKNHTDALKEGSASLYIGDRTFQQPIAKGDREVEFELEIEQGTHSLESLIETKDQSIPAHGAFYAEVEYLRDK